MLKLDSFIFNPFMEQTYVLYDEDSLECFIIDPGCSNADEENRLFGFIDSHRLKPLKIINTHGHIDHIIGNEAVMKRYGIRSAAHPDVKQDFIDSKSESSWLGLGKDCSFPLPDDALSDGDILHLGGSTLEVICTPGHAQGSISLYAQIEGWVFTGDALFCRSIGRTDLRGGDYIQLCASIKERLFRLPDDTTVFPGHGESTTIFDEQRYNLYLD